MRPQLTLALLFVAVLAGCGSTPPSPESVVRAWSQELNTGDNEDAAKLFAPGAEIVQAGTTLRLDTQAEAIAWNAALPCSGRIVSITTNGDTTSATFILGDRPRSRAERKDRALAPDQHGAGAGRPGGLAWLRELRREVGELAPDRAERTLAEHERLDDVRVELPL